MKTLEGEGGRRLRAHAHLGGHAVPAILDGSQPLTAAYPVHYDAA